MVCNSVIVHTIVRENLSDGFGNLGGGGSGTIRHSGHYLTQVLLH